MLEYQIGAKSKSYALHTFCILSAHFIKNIYSSMPSECVAGATIPHGFECTLTCPTGSHADAMGTHPSCTYGSFSGSVNCISSGVSADSTLLGLTSAIIVTLVLA